MSLTATRVAGRAQPRLELVVEFARADGGAAHQAVALRAPALLAEARRGALPALARALQALEPATLGRAPEGALVEVLRALAEAVEAGAGGAASAPAAQPAPPPAPAAPPALAGVLAGIGDLQRAGPSALQAAKAKMELVFEANAVKPGDAAYVYDKRANFVEPSEASEWD